MRPPTRIGRFEIESALGYGGVAEVWLGVAQGPGGAREEVALKRTVPERARDQEEGPLLAEGLRAEARLLSVLHHPGIVGYLGLLDEGAPVIVLERLRGLTVAELILRGPLELELAEELVAQAAAALAAVHAVCDEDGAPLSAVHCDVSPDNLFVTEDGGLKLFDFNVSSFRDRGPALTGTLKGRVAYMAPEQARGEPVLGTSDVFALGVVLWELVVGERLFWRGNTLATLRALLDEPVPRARSRRPDLPSALDDLLARTLAPRPEVRPSAAVVAKSLRDLLVSARSSDEARRAVLAARVAAR